MFLKSLNPLGRIRELVQELRRTQEERDQARRRNEQLEKENQQFQEEIKRLRKELDTAQRAARRQAAPFSRGQTKSQPKRPGRKSGDGHGPHHCRPIPDHVDEEITVAVPEQCPDCGGPLTVERVESQYQEETCGALGCGALISLSAGVRNAPSVCRDGIPCKPPMRLGRRRCKWDRRR